MSTASPTHSRAYYEAYSTHLIDNGYLRSTSDSCLFYNIISPDRKVYVRIHVDDTLVAASRAEDIEEFKDAIRKRFRITVNEVADQHLGVNIKKNQDGSITLTQSKMLKNIFDEFLDEAKTGRKRISVPMRTIIRRRTYLHLLGMLNYLLRSRPDFSTALAFASTKSVNPTASDYQALLEVVYYLWGTKHLGLKIHPGDPLQPLTLRCYVDASYLTHPDGRGHTGYCICLGSIGSFYLDIISHQYT